MPRPRATVVAAVCFSQLPPTGYVDSGSHTATSIRSLATNSRLRMTFFSILTSCASFLARSGPKAPAALRRRACPRTLVNVSTASPEPGNRVIMTRGSWEIAGVTHRILHGQRCGQTLCSTAAGAGSVDLEVSETRLVALHDNSRSYLNLRSRWRPCGAHRVCAVHGDGARVVLVEMFRWLGQW